MQEKVDPAIELAAKDAESHDWLSVQVWRALISGIVRVKHLCCFRDWSDPYPGTAGVRSDFICGECGQRGPIERVPDDVFGREETRKAFRLGFCPYDPRCSGERLKPVSCACVFANEVNGFCDRPDEVLRSDHISAISREKAQDAYWAFSCFKKHIPDWDPTGAYDGAFERWGKDCAREGISPWGPEGPPEPVPLVDRIRQERMEALTGAQRAYEKIMAPAERVFEQALTEAARIRDEAKVRFNSNQSEEIRRWLAGPHRIDRRLVAEIRAAQWAAQMKSNQEYAARYPSLSSSRNYHPRRDGDPPGHPPTEIPPPSEEEAAYTHLTATIRRTYEKAEAVALRSHGNSAARAERAYAKAMAASEPSRNGTANEEAAWEALIQLAYRLTELGKRVDQAIGRFRTLDVTESKDTTAGMKRAVRSDLGLPAQKAPSPPRGPREENRERYREVMQLAAKNDLSIKQIAYQTGTNYHTARRWILKSRSPLDY